VLAQFALMAAIVVSWIAIPPRWPDLLATPLALVGLVLAFAGAVLAVWAARALGRVTPLPEPRRDAELIEDGPYRLARHPMYGGALLFFAGLSLVWSVVGLLLTGVLAVLWSRKSLVEEDRLIARFEGYEEYRERTPHRFLPYVFLPYLG
jgi:protein-S-isoprenylcysteine O-methyltransferase Ste14